MGRRTAFFAMTALVGCSPPAPPVETPRAQAGWRVSHDAPVIAAGSLRPKGLWNDPSVVRDGSGYVMYLTSSVGEPFKPPVLPFRATSPDGVTWMLDPQGPLLQPVAPYASIETPSVVRFAGRWHMFFTGVYANPDPAPMAIGHAISDDGIHWQIDRPVLIAATGRAGDWNSYLVAEPGAVVVGDRLLVYFSAVGGRASGAPPQMQTIGAVRSTDGVTFSAPVQVLAQGPLYPATLGYAGYSSPAATVANGRVQLFYSVAHYTKGGDPEWQQVAIEHASSADGLTGFAEDAAPILTRDSTGWTSGEVLAPAPLVDGGTLKLWFAGHVRNRDLGPLIARGVAGPEFGIGLATRDLSDFVTATNNPSQGEKR
jgi:hypothetical protein